MVRRGHWTYVDDHPADDFIVGDEVGILLLCFEKAVEEIFLVGTERGVLHTFHVTLDGETGGHGEVVEFVEGARPFRVLAQPVVESGDLTDLLEISMILPSGVPS
jgi:hypothetical protein